MAWALPLDGKRLCQSTFYPAPRPPIGSNGNASSSRSPFSARKSLAEVGAAVDEGLFLSLRC